MKPPLVLVDGSSYFFRAFHALPPLTTSKGKPTGAVYGVASMIKRLSKDYPSSQIIIVFDAKGKNFRHDWFPDYKAHRPPIPDNLLSQFEPLVDLLTAMGFPLLIVEGVEADDVIGTLAKAASEAAIPVVISTGDKDMAQLVNEHVTLINTMTNQSYDINGVMTKFSVAPRQIVDYLALIGDSVDNVPGVANCGPKTAAKWLQQFESLENLIENASQIKGKIGKNLRDSLSLLPLAKQLVTIKTDVVLPCTLDSLVRKDPCLDKLIALVQDLEFKAWLKELVENGKETRPARLTQMPFGVITTAQEFNHLVEKLSKHRFICVDTETTNIDPMQADLVGFSVKMNGDIPYYIPLAHKDGSQQPAKEEVLAAFKRLLEDPSIKKLGQNLKYDYVIFKNASITLKGIAFDTMLESYILNSSATRHDMDTLALKYLGQKTIRFEDIAGKGAKQLRFDEIPVEQAAPYAAEDVEVTWNLHEVLYSQLDSRLKTVLEEIEIPLIAVLADMERRGVLIDTSMLMVHGQRLKARMLALEKEAIDLAGGPFNLNSPKQLQTLLFDVFKLPILAKTPTGQPSTAENVLQDLAYDYRLPAVILEFRSLSKLVSTYIDALPKRINPITGRVHTSYNQAVAATGRLSSSEPNLQNIPVRTEEGRLIRTAFIAPPGHQILAFDYSQIELRIMAHISEDSGLLQAFAQDLDIHTATAAEIFQLPLDQVTSEHRRRAKAINFGLIYGMSAFGLSKQLGIERQEAHHYVEQYFHRYPGVRHYMETTRKKAHEQGFVETLFGRRLYLPEINTSNLARQRAAERMAINAPMQGTAADIIKKAMLSVAAWQATTNNVFLIMQVHDELVFEVENAAVDSAKQAICMLMENTVSLKVPLKVSVGQGSNWEEAH